MTVNKIEETLKSGYEKITPNIFETILLDAEKEKSVPTVLPAPKKKKRLALRFAGIAAALVMLAGAFIIQHNWHIQNDVASVISLDVNPSIEIFANAKERVLSVSPLNEDGSRIIGDMDLSGSTVDVAVNAIVGSMLRNGYITELANSILISIDNNDPQTAAELQQRLMDQVTGLINTSNLSGAVLSQVVTGDQAAKDIADSCNISVGKARLILKLTEKHPAYDIQELSRLSINELNNLYNNGVASVPAQEENQTAITSVGQASTQSYIGDAAAKEIALNHAGVSASDAEYMSCMLDWDDGRMVYDVEFYAGTKEYDYEIDAVTGEICSYDIEGRDDSDERPDNSGNPSGNAVPETTAPANENSGTGSDTTKPDNTSAKMITKAQAKKRALAKAGVSADDLRDYEIELDYDYGRAVYDIDFEAGNYEYSVDVDAYSGEILKFEREWDDDAPVSTTKAQPETTKAQPETTKAQPETTKAQPETTKASGELISKAKAKEKALAKAGVSADSIRGYKIELDYDDGRAVYEIEFYSGKYEYSIEVDASSGKIRDYDRERDDDAPVETTKAQPETTKAQPETTKASGELISKAQAKEKALAKAGVSADSIRGYKIELDYDDGRAIYEIEFYSGDYEYSIEMDASSGKILEYDREKDD